MLLESYIAYTINKFKLESYSDEHKTQSFVSIIEFILNVLTFMVAFYLWMRFVVFAFECSNAQGLSAFFFTSFYIFYKFTNMMKTYCRNKNI